MYHMMWCVSPPARYSPEGAEVDVRSCVLSLVDLFSHWLSQPLHSLLLLHTLRAILMLSDLFSVVSVDCHVRIEEHCFPVCVCSMQASQFEWMLQVASELIEKQPLEDSAAHSLLIHCLLKAAAVLKVVSSSYHIPGVHSLSLSLL